MNTNKELTYEEAINAFSYDIATGNLLRNYPSRQSDRGSVCGTLMANGYLSLWYKNRTYLVHRIIWLMHNKQWPKNQIDHINRIRNDNRIENLRDVTQSRNNNNNQAKGYSYNSSTGGYMARITVDGQFIYLGVYATKNMAHDAYMKAKAIYGV